MVLYKKKNPQNRSIITFSLNDYAKTLQSVYMRIKYKVVYYITVPDYRRKSRS